MTDEQLFWLGLGAASLGLVVCLAAMWPHIRWAWRNRSSRRGGIVDGHKWL